MTGKRSDLVTLLCVIHSTPHPRLACLVRATEGWLEARNSRGSQGQLDEEQGGQPIAVKLALPA